MASLDFSRNWPDIPVAEETNKPHVVYDLGPPLRVEPVPSDQNYRANPMWVLLDRLFTCDTLAEAMANTGKLFQTKPS